MDDVTKILYLYSTLTVFISWLQKNSTVVAATLLTAMFLTAIITVTDVHPSKNSAINIWIHFDSVKNNVSKNFLSVALGSDLLASGKMVNLIHSSKVFKLTKYLSPGYLRIGGNSADLVVFHKDGPKKMLFHQENQTACSFYDWDVSDNCSPTKPSHPIIMTGEEWLAINEAAQLVGHTVLFDLNALLRTSDGSWNSSNAEELLRFSTENNISAVWQLGNEPNSFHHKFGVTVPPRQLGKDFNNLRKLLQDKKYSCGSLLVGPDVTHPKIPSLSDESMSFLRSFLRVAGKSLHAVTWHQYYFNGRTAHLKDFINLTYFDVLSKQIQAVKNIVSSTVPGGVPLWLSETSEAYGGGAPGLSSRFVATFMWLDKLGVAARDGVYVVVKQTLVGRYYGLIDERTLHPTPTWWVSLLFKKLVGTEVFQVHYPLAPPGFRIYGHRSAKSDQDNVLFGVNLHKELKLKIHHGCSEGLSAEEYILSAPNDDLESKSVLLNGKLLRLEPDGSIPPLDPHYIFDDFTVPPYSLFFLVMKKGGISC